MKAQTEANVSIIIPCYNHAHYLGDAVNSVLAQSYGDWEAIIVDDGSTDPTREVAAEFGDPRVRYIHQENQGLSAARNTGICAANGQHLAFLDADDELTPRFLEVCLGALRADPTLVGVYTWTYFMDEEGRQLPSIGDQSVPKEDFREHILEGGFFPPVASLIRTAVVRQLGGFDTELTSLEDWDLWCRISLKYPMQGIPEPLVRYRVYPGSMSTNAARMHANRLAVLTKHFGPPEGNPSDWDADKRRAYGFGYRASSRGFIEQGQSSRGWTLLKQAVRLWPDLLSRLDTFYEIACGDLPKGYRGQASRSDIEQNGEEMIRRLDELFASAGESVQSHKSVAYGNAHLALAMLSDQAGRWSRARAYVVRAIYAHAALLLDPLIIRRLIKLCAGRRIVERIRGLRT